MQKWRLILSLVVPPGWSKKGFVSLALLFLLLPLYGISNLEFLVLDIVACFKFAR